jgi:hypothetical protein
VRVPTLLAFLETQATLIASAGKLLVGKRGDDYGGDDTHGSRGRTGGR